MTLGRSGTSTDRHTDRKRRAVGVFADRHTAERALQELSSSGFNMNRVSVIARDGDRESNIAGAEVSDQVGNKADDGAKVGAVSGGVLGGLTGLLVGLGTLAIPGVGPIVLAGEVATALATTAAGGAIGAAAGGLVGALVGLGIPEERARVYNDRVSQGGYLVIVDGTEQEISQAEAILHRGGIEEYGVYDAPTPASDATYASTGTASATTGVPGTPATDRSFSQQKRAVGVFSHRRDAEAALTELRDSGFSMNQVSILGKDSTSGAGVGTNVAQGERGNKADDGAKAGATTGAAVGGLGGLLVGLGVLAIPGLGPIVAGGAAATALATALSGGALGAAAGGIVGGLVGLGIPENRAKVYNDRLERGDYLVIVDGSEAEVRQAETLLKRRGIDEWDIYDRTDDAAYATSDMAANTRPTDLTTPPPSGSGPDVVVVDRRMENR